MAWDHAQEKISCARPPTVYAAEFGPVERDEQVTMTLTLNRAREVGSQGCRCPWAPNDVFAYSSRSWLMDRPKFSSPTGRTDRCCTPWHKRCIIVARVSNSILTSSTISGQFPLFARMLPPAIPQKQQATVPLGQSLFLGRSGNRGLGMLSQTSMPRLASTNRIKPIPG